VARSVGLSQPHITVPASKACARSLPQASRALSRLRPLSDQVGHKRRVGSIRLRSDLDADAALLDAPSANAQYAEHALSYFSPAVDSIDCACWRVFLGLVLRRGEAWAGAAVPPAELHLAPSASSWTTLSTTVRADSPRPFFAVQDQETFPWRSSPIRAWSRNAAVDRDIRASGTLRSDPNSRRLWPPKQSLDQRRLRTRSDIGL